MIVEFFSPPWTMKRIAVVRSTERPLSDTGRRSGRNGRKCRCKLDSETFAHFEEWGEFYNELKLEITAPDSLDLFCLLSEKLEGTSQ